MNSYPVQEKMRNFLSVVAGVLVAILLIAIIGLLSSHLIIPPYVREDPTRYAIFKESIYRADAWKEIGTLIGAFFAGGLVASLISTRKDIVHALLVPPITLCIIWFSTIGMDVVVLALPLWMLIALVAYKLSCWIKWKRKRKRAI
jgi:hypothetical protein